MNAQPKRSAHKTPTTGRRARRSAGARPPGEMPRTPDELDAWLRQHLDVRSPRAGLLSSSDPPFDYLRHAFFEGRGCAPGVRPRVRPDAHPAPQSPTAPQPPESPPVLRPRLALPPPSADCVVWANRGGGKTFLGAVATLLDLCWKPGIEVRILGGSLEQSRRMYHHLREFFARDEFEPLVAGKMTRDQIELRNGSRVQVLAQSESAVRGTRVQKIRCDEVDLFDPEIWRAAQLTTRSLQVGPPWSGWVRGCVEALSTMHRPMGLMWNVIGETAGPAPARRLFRWGIVDALEHCPPERDCHTCALSPECAGRAKQRTPEHAGHVSIDDAVAQKRRVSLPVWESEMLCLRPSRGAAVYPEFDPTVHVFTPDPDSAGTQVASSTSDVAKNAEPDQSRATPTPPTDELAPIRIEVPRRVRRARSGRTLICGMDFGFRNPTVILWAEVRPSPEPGAPPIVRVLAERVATEMRFEHHLRALEQHPLGRPDWIGIDPAGEQREMTSGTSPAQMLRDSGFVVRVDRASIVAGIAAVRGRIAPAAWVHRAATVPDNAPANADTKFLQLSPTLFVSAACPKLIASLTKYHYDELRPEVLEPVKDGPDHACDALRYLLLSLDRPNRTKRIAG